MKFLKTLCLAALTTTALVVLAPDAEAKSVSQRANSRRQSVSVQKNRTAGRRTGACPTASSTASNGSRCGSRSAYDRGPTRQYDSEPTTVYRGEYGTVVPAASPATIAEPVQQRELSLGNIRRDGIFLMLDMTVNGVTAPMYVSNESPLALNGLPVSFGLAREDELRVIASLRAAEQQGAFAPPVAAAVMPKAETLVASPQGDGYMNLRQSPNGSIVQQVADGSSVFVLGTVEVEGKQWAQVQLRNGTRGYMLSAGIR